MLTVKHILFNIVLVLLFACQHITPAQNLVYRHALFVSNGDTLPYRIMYPYGFNAETEYPLILFLHGSGERGNDNETQLIHGGNLFSSLENSRQYPAVVVFPQCGQEDYWASVTITQHANNQRFFDCTPVNQPTTALRLAMELLDSLLTLGWIDTSRVYAGGLSMGGMATFELLYRKPEVFAAAFPICGAGNPDMINKNVKDVKVWAFHGEVDPVISVNYSIKMIDALKKNGAKTKLTIYTGAGHNVWDAAFSEPDFMSWLFSAHKK